MAGEERVMSGARDQEPKRRGKRGGLRVAAAVFALLLAQWLPMTHAAAGTGPLSLKEARGHLELGELDEIYLAFADVKGGDHPEGDEAVASFLIDAAGAALRAGDAFLALGMAQVAGRLSPGSPGAALVMADAALEMEQKGVAAAALDGALQAAPEDGELLFRRATLSEQERELGAAAELYARVPEGHARHAEAVEGVRRVTRALEERKAALEQVARAEASVLARQEEARRAISEEAHTAPRADSAARKQTVERRTSPFDPVGGEYLPGELGRAREDARAQGKPVTLILADPQSRCAAARAMLRDTRAHLGGHSIIVLVSTRDPAAFQRLPARVRSALRDPASGGRLPMTVIFNGSLSRVLLHVPYQPGGTTRRASLTHAQSVVRDYRRSQGG